MAPQISTQRMASASPQIRRGLGVQGIVLLVGLAAFLGFVVWAFFKAWALAGPTRMTVHGWIAMGLAAVFVLALGGGLMWLAFYSERRGYDGRVDVDED